MLQTKEGRRSRRAVLRCGRSFAETGRWEEFGIALAPRPCRIENRTPPVIVNEGEDLSPPLVGPSHVICEACRVPPVGNAEMVRMWLDLICAHVLQPSGSYRPRSEQCCPFFPLFFFLEHLLTFDMG